MPRTASLLAVAAAALAGSSGVAHAALSLPSAGTLVTQTTGSLLPGTGDVVDQAVGGLIEVVGDIGAPTGTTGVTDPVVGAVGDVLGVLGETTTGATGGTTGGTTTIPTGTANPGPAPTGPMPTGSLDTVLQALLGVAPASAPAVGGSGTQPAGSVLDRQAPAVAIRVLSRLRRAARTGRLRLRVASDEPAVVAFSSLLRPGRALRAGGRARRVSRRLIRIKPIVVAFRRAGSLDVTVRLARAARRNLGRTRDARMALRLWAADAVRNQAAAQLRRTIRR